MKTVVPKDQAPTAEPSRYCDRPQKAQHTREATGWHQPSRQSLANQEVFLRAQSKKNEQLRKVLSGFRGRPYALKLPKAA
jgi:hypothetical protein